MNPTDRETEYLFAYGTLQTEAVQIAVFGRRLAGQPDILVGYSLKISEIQDQKFIANSGSAHHRNLQFTNIASDFVAGTVFTVTKQELEYADAYEPIDYKRAIVQLKSGINAWVYLNVHP